jgi:hypothetical protein
VKVDLLFQQRGKVHAKGIGLIPKMLPGQGRRFLHHASELPREHKARLGIGYGRYLDG